jgi:predicted permease
MESISRDIRFALRLLWRDRGFAATTVATLALCVAANTAIFAVVNSVILEPLPSPDASRLVTVYNSYPAAGALRASNGVPDYFDRLAQVPALDEIAMYRTNGVTLGGQGEGEVERVTSMPVTPSFFRMLGAQAFRGRTFGEDDAVVGQNRKVLLSHGLWQRRHAGNDAVIGQDIRINGVPYAVVGVMPETFRFIDPDVQLWTPAAFSAADRADDRRHSNNWQQIGRLAPGATIEQAQSQIDALNASNLERFPALKTALINAGFITVTRPFKADLIESARPTLYLLWGGVLTLLVIGCVNVTNLVSIRASTRARELATRHALGASLRRLSAQILTETVILAVAGGMLGVLLAWWALQGVSALGLSDLPRGDQIALDGRTLIFSLFMIVTVGVLVGLLPILALRRADLGQVVREEGRMGTTSRRTRAVRRVLVTSQVAFALVLLVAAGLLLASFERVLAVDVGFDASRVLTGSISLPAARYADDAALRTVTPRIVDAMREVPGVEAAGLTSFLPLADQHNDSVILADGYQMAPGESLISPNQVRVSPGYLEAMGTALRHGRLFDARDTAEAPRVIIVDDRLARRFWPKQDPLGRYMYFPTDVRDLMTPPPKDQWLTVVGVVEDVRLDSLVDGAVFKTVGAYYLPLSQATASTVTLAVRTAGEPASVTAGIRRALAQVDAELPFYGVRTMADRVERSLVDRRTPMLLATSFAATALLLAAIGIYGVLAYQVAQRTREIGIRLALGSAHSRIFIMVLQEGAAMVGVGTALGVGGALLLRQTLQSQLYEVGASDPRVLVGVALLLVIVAFVACLLPARNAARTDPVVALAGQ